MIKAVLATILETFSSPIVTLDRLDYYTRNGLDPLKDNFEALGLYVDADGDVCQEESA